MCLSAVCQPPADCSRQEEDDDHRRRDPERPVQVRIPVQDVEKVGAREDGGLASTEHFRRIYIEELGVKGDGPQIALRREGAFARAWSGRRRVLRREGVGCCLDWFGARVGVCEVLMRCLVSIGWAQCSEL